MRILKFTFPLLALLFPLSAFASTHVIYLTSGSSWTVPSDWNSSNNSIEVIGGGGNGGAGASDSSFNGGTGGTGGGYSKSTNVALTPGASVTYAVGAAGGGNTYFCNSTTNCASIAGTAVVVGANGASASAVGAVGSVKFGGGPGAGGSGGGAAGPHGAGATGPGDAGYTPAGQNGTQFDASHGSGGGGSGGAGGTNGTSYATNCSTRGGMPDLVGPTTDPGGFRAGTSGSAAGTYGGGGGGGGAAGHYVCSYQGTDAYIGAGSGGAGAPGIIVITYGDTPPSCSVTFDQNPLTGQSTTMHWSSTGATLFYINNVGYVGASGSAQVFSAGDYSGTVSGAGGVANCSAILQGQNQNQCIPATSSGNGSGANSPSPDKAPYWLDTAPKVGGNSQGAIVSGDVTAQLDSDTTGITAYMFCRVGANGAEMDQAQFWVKDKNATVTYTSDPVACKSPTTVYFNEPGVAGCGSGGCYGSSYTIDLPPSGAPYAVRTAGYGRNGWAPDNFIFDAYLQITEHKTPSTLQGNSSQTSGTSGSVAYVCSADGNLRDSCNNVVTCQYGCSAATNQCNTNLTCHAFNVCNAAGTKVVNSCTGATVSDCSAAGKACIAGACVLASVAFQSFAATNPGGNFTANGHLRALPTLLPSGATTSLYWNVVNAAGCAITGTNGDSWSTLFSGSAGKTTAPITQQTTYTLTCQALPGATPALVQESATVNVLPVFQEI